MGPAQVAGGVGIGGVGRVGGVGGVGGVGRAGGLFTGTGEGTGMPVAGRLGVGVSDGDGSGVGLAAGADGWALGRPVGTGSPDGAACTGVRGPPGSGSWTGSRSRIAGCCSVSTRTAPAPTTIPTTIPSSIQSGRRRRMLVAGT